MRILFESAAQQEFSAAQSYYQAARPGLDQRFVAEVENTLQLIRRYPSASVRVSQDLRMIALNNFPFSIIYSFIDEEITIIAVAHHSRRPGYWIERVEEIRPPTYAVEAQIAA